MTSSDHYHRSATNANRSTRIETDSMGSIGVPADRYWGDQTQRSLEKAAASTNQELGVLDARRSAWTVEAAAEVVGRALEDPSPLRVRLTSSGTQINMNANEAISNRARIAHNAQPEGTSVREACLDAGALSEAEYDELVNLRRMAHLHPGRR